MAKKVKTYYDTWTKHYLKSGYGNVIQAHRPAETNELLAYTASQADMKDGMHILDAGCGVCGPAVFFAQKFDVQIQAISISEEQVKLAQKKIAKNNLGNKISAIEGDFHKLDTFYEKETFDLIIMLESYGHAKKHKQVLQSAEKVLKKGGQIYIKDYFRKEFTGNRKRRLGMKRAMRNMNKVYAYNLPDLTETIRILRRLDLNLIKVNRHNLPLDNEKSVQQFEKEHGIDLFEGGLHYLFLEPLELLFVKPENIDAPIT